MAGPNQAAAAKTGAAISKLLSNQQLAFQQAAFEASNDLRNALIREVSNASPSPPGSPPGVRSGTLRNSIFATPVVSGGNNIVIEVGSRVAHATFLEYGTRRMAPRPWLRTTIARETPNINKKVVARIQAVLP